jgi:hypothetical protein
MEYLFNVVTKRNVMYSACVYIHSALFINHKEGWLESIFHKSLCSVYAQLLVRAGMRPWRAAVQLVVWGL